MTPADLTPAETSAMYALEGGAWTPTRLLPPDALTSLTTRGLVEVSTWSEWWPSSGHVIHGFEVKVSRSDWLTELKDPEKAEAFKPYCDHWWLVTPTADIVRDDLPEGWGHLTVAPTGVLRARVSAPRRKPEPMPFEMTASWLRATAKTARNSA